MMYYNFSYFKNFTINSRKLKKEIHISVQEKASTQWKEIKTEITKFKKLFKKYI